MFNRCIKCGDQGPMFELFSIPQLCLQCHTTPKKPFPFQEVSADEIVPKFEPLGEFNFVRVFTCFYCGEESSHDACFDYRTPQQGPYCGCSPSKWIKGEDR